MSPQHLSRYSTLIRKHQARGYTLCRRCCAFVSGGCHSWNKTWLGVSTEHILELVRPESRSGLCMDTCTPLYRTSLAELLLLPGALANPLLQILTVIQTWRTLLSAKQVS